MQRRAPGPSVSGVARTSQTNGRDENSTPSVMMSSGSSMAEQIQVGVEVCHVPYDLFLLRDPSEIFSLDTWNALPESDRQQLARFLPSTDQASPANLLSHVFEDPNFHFGNPTEEFWKNMSSGMLHPRVATLNDSFKELQRRQHYHNLREYHNNMISSLLEMKSLWEEGSDVDLRVKLRAWKKHKQTQLHHDNRRSLGGDDGKGRLPLVKSEPSYGHTPPHGDAPSRRKQTTEITSGIERIRPMSVLSNERAVAGEARAFSKYPQIALDEDGDMKPRIKKNRMSNTPPPPPPLPTLPDVGFSVKHLLSAVRTALLLALRTSTEGDPNSGWSHTADIFENVSKNPGDQKILSVPIRLGELVLSALKVLQTKAPPGTRLWKPFVQQRKQGMEWNWCGIVPSSDEDLSVVNVDTEWWGVSEKALFKLQERFIELMPQDLTMTAGGSRPEHLTDSRRKLLGGPKGAKGRGILGENGEMQNEYGVSGTDGGNELALTGSQKKLAKRRSQQSTAFSWVFDSFQNAPPPDPGDKVAYFQYEERQRYATAMNVFQYTAVDGGKSSVAPVLRSGGKAITRARDHAMLKTDRPPHVTVLCLVRDAAARMPHGEGTRADVCNLLRESQFFVRDISDAQMNHIVSGALDRLHYERDPCVKYDAERKVWTYLHRWRSEADFPVDGTMSTRTWKKKPNDGGSEDVMEGGEDVASEGVKQDLPLVNYSDQRIGNGAVRVVSDELMKAEEELEDEGYEEEQEDVSTNSDGSSDQ